MYVEFCRLYSVLYPAYEYEYECARLIVCDMIFGVCVVVRARPPNIDATSGAGGGGGSYRRATAAARAQCRVRSASLY